MPPLWVMVALGSFVSGIHAAGTFGHPPMGSDDSSLHGLSLNEVLVETLLEESLGEETQGDTVVVDADTGGVSHIKVSALPLQYDVAAGLAMSVAQHQEGLALLQAAERDLQAAVSDLEAGALLDQATPADGHCLFHALVRGGIARLEDVPCKLSVSELRAMALSMASEEELSVAAASTGEGIPVQEYKTQMQSNLWGDNLMISMLCRCFKVSIAVITNQASRTWFAYGTEAAGADLEAIWIAHRGEWHYYGVERAAAASQPAAICGRPI